MATLFSQSTQIFQRYLIHEFHHRKLLLNTTLSDAPVASTPLRSNNTIPSLHQYKLDANVVLVLLVLLGALICSLGMKPMMRCAFICLNFANTNAADRLAHTGVNKKALRKFPTTNYSPDKKLETECVICLSEFVVGDVVRILPNCGHGFHVVCIDKWLSSHSSCPTCRHCLLENYNKIASGDYQAEASSSEPVAVVQRGLVRPLEREGVMNNSGRSWKDFNYMALV